MSNIEVHSIIKKIVFFVVLMILIALLFNWVSPNGIPLVIEIRKVSIGDEVYEIPIFKSKNRLKESEEKIYSITEVNLSTAVDLFHATEPIFLDARSKEEYRAGHIPGALNVPIESIEIFDLDFFEFGKDQKFVCYCNDKKCDLSLQLAIWLEEKGFSKIYYFSDGWEKWYKAGHQVSRGPKP